MNQEDQFILPATGNKISQPVKLLVFTVGSSKFGALVDEIRTIIDLEEATEYLHYETDVNCIYEKGNVSIQAINLERLLFPSDVAADDNEKKLILIKTKLNSLNGVIVDHIDGVGTFTGLYPFPFGIFKSGGGIFRYVVTSEEPWFEVVDFSKIIEIYGFQQAKVENV